MSGRKLKVAGLQMSCQIEDKEANIQKALRLIGKASQEGVDIALLPELFTTDYLCYCGEDNKCVEYAEPIPGPTTDRIGKKAKECEISIIAPIYEKAAHGIFYDTAAVIGHSGQIIGKFRKMHIPATAGGLEKVHFRPGSELPVFKTKFGDIGGLICYDRYFPEVWRILALKGAEILFIPSATLYPRKGFGGGAAFDVWELVPRALAFLNGVFAVVGNRVGKEGKNAYFGKSLIIAPNGKIMKKGPEDQEAVVSVTIDLEEVNKSRVDFPLFRDLRPELYSQLYVVP